MMDKVQDLRSLEYLTPVVCVTGDTVLIHYALDPSHSVKNRYVAFITGFWKARQAVQYRQEVARIAARNFSVLNILARLLCFIIPSIFVFLIMLLFRAKELC